MEPRAMLTVDLRLISSPLHSRALRAILIGLFRFAGEIHHDFYIIYVFIFILRYKLKPNHC